MSNTDIFALVNKTPEELSLECAVAVKQHLINLAVEDKLPMDLNQLNEVAIQDVILQIVAPVDSKTFEAVKECLILVTGDVNDFITLDTTLDDLGLDSLDTVEFVMELEKKFNCSIDDNAMEQLRTVKDACLTVKALTNGVQ